MKRVSLATARVEVAENLGEASDGTLRLGPTKTHQRRTVPVAAFLVERLRPLTAGKSGEDFVFTAPGGGPVRHHNFYARAFKPGVRSVGLDESLRFHDLRHTCAAWLVDSGAHVRAVMEWLGHSSPSVTLGAYGHLFPSLTEKLVDGLQARWEALERAPVPRRSRDQPGSTPGPRGRLPVGPADQDAPVRPGPSVLAR